MKWKIVADFLLLSNIYPLVKLLHILNSSTDSQTCYKASLYDLRELQILAIYIKKYIWEILSNLLLKDYNATIYDNVYEWNNSDEV